ncbi:MAG: sel1 repeat family protein [Magnetococcales bacterium]|nr:sel1 repeat family protein [Magnetococcales bacterium]
MIKISRTIPILFMAACFATVTTLHAQPLPTTAPLKSASSTTNKDPFMTAYIKLADKGDIRAQTTLGTLYLQKESASYDPHAAYKWFSLAANGGDKLAQFNLGLLYQQGLGTDKDHQQAKEWFLRVVEPSNKDSNITSEMLAWAQLKLGIIFHDGKGAPVNYTEAFKWFSKLTANNHAYGQYMVGIMHAKGHGVPKSYKKAVPWLKAAAAQGLESAKNELMVIQSLLMLDPKYARTLHAKNVDLTPANSILKTTPTLSDKLIMPINNDAGTIHPKLDDAIIKVNNDARIMQFNMA